MHKNFVFQQHQVSSRKRNYTLLNIVCRPLLEAGFIHAFTTRLGGVSPLPSEALNLSDKKDKLFHVKENQRRLLESLNLEQWPLILGTQIHSDRRVRVTSQKIKKAKKIVTDAFFSQQENILIGVKVADCVPILLGDPSTGFFAAVHAGWKGTLARIVQKTTKDLLKMKANKSSLVAAIGPAACVKCYEIQDDVLRQFREEFPLWKKFIRHVKKGAQIYLNTPEANRQQLLELGIKPQNIHVASFCTMHHNNLFFSHRKESQSGQVQVGRQAAVIGRLS